MKYLRLLSTLVLSVMFGWGAFAQETEKPDWRALHYLSQEEMESGFNNRLTNFTATAAPSGPVRFPGEFEPMQAVMVRYPLGLPVSFIKTLAEECKVITLVSSSNLSSARSAYNSGGVNMDNCEFVTCTTDSYWVRDYGPWFIFNDRTPAIVDFRYNRPRENDDIIPVTLANNYFNVSWYGMDVTHTGGNMMEDGRGFGISDVLVVNESTSSESGYSNITEAQIYERMEAYLGIDNYLVTDDPQGQYIAHVDCWGKLLAPDKVIIARMPTTDDRYQYYEEIADYFATTNCCWGYPYQVYRVDEISSTTSTSTSYLAPYTNSLILNDRVFVPLGSNTTYNNNALAVYREAMPGYTVIGVSSNSSYAWYNTDALHCRTRGVMDFEMLFVDHRNVIHGEQPLQHAYEITSTFIPYSGQNLISNQLLIYYRINEGEWQTAPMTATNNSDEYTGYITGCTYGDAVEYYVSASDASGRTATQPVMGALDPHSFTIEAAPVSYTITVSANPTSYGTVSGGGTFGEGENVIVVATPNGNNTFVNWTENGDVVSTSATYSFAAAADRNLVANFESNLHWIPDVDEYDNYTPITAIVQIDGVEQFTDNLEVGVFCGDQCRASAVGELFPFNNKYLLMLMVYGNAEESYSFRLYDHAAGAELTPDLIAPANVTFDADGYGSPSDPYVLNFTSAIVEYTVTVSASPTEGGTVTGGGTFTAGAEATVSATANEGYTFFNWSLNGHTVSTDASYTFTVDANKELVANFNLNTYIVTVNVNPVEGGTVTGAGTYSHGQTVTLSATANDSYRFIGWMDGDDVLSSDATYTFTAESDVTLTAKFSSLLHWTAVTNQLENNMNMSAIVQIDGVEQFTSNYEVGVFVGDECRASAIGLPTPFNNHYVLSLLIYGTTGESFTFRLYDHATETELTPDLNSPAAVSFNTDGYGSPVDPYVLNFTSTIAMVSQTFSLNSGWNWWSTYVELSNMDGLDLLEEGLGTNGKTINSQADGSAMYLSGSWMNGIGHNLNNENMFQIELSNAVDFTLSGPLADPSDHEITLANGWNWIGYPVNQTLTVANALANLEATPDDIIKYQNGFATYYASYGWFGTLKNLEAGKGYMYHSLNTNNVSFTYPASSKEAASVEVDADREMRWNADCSNYANNMNIIAVVNLNGSELRNAEAEIAAFDEDGTCRGTTQLLYVAPIDRYVAFLTLCGEGGELLRLRLAHEGTEYDVEESMIMSVNSVMGTLDNPVAINAKGTTGVAQCSASIGLYPNPTEKGQTVRLEIPESMENATVEIIDVLGRVLRTAILDGNALNAPEAPGVYTLKIQGNGPTWYGKLIVK